MFQVDVRPLSRTRADTVWSDQRIYERRAEARTATAD